MLLDAENAANNSKGGVCIMASSEAAKRAVRRYDEKRTRQIKLKLNVGTDADILEKLDSVPNKQGYIKQLIRDDLKKH